MPKYRKSATIVSGSSQSGRVSLNEMTPVGLVISGSVLTGTTITFLVSNDGINFYPLYDSDSAEVSLTVGGSPISYNLNPAVFMPWNFVKARLGTSSASVAQTTYDAQVEFITDSM